MEYDKYIYLIIEALKKIKEPYFVVNAVGRIGFHRERVFCYEFYHQMRILLGDYDSIIINGEIDKSGTETFKDNPDFIFHEQGINNKNLIVVEVKGTIENRYSSTPHPIVKDFLKISKFLNHRNKEKSYKIGVFILYNYDFQNFENEFKDRLIHVFASKYNRNIYIITIKECNGKVEIKHFSQFFE